MANSHRSATRTCPYPPRADASGKIAGVLDPRGVLQQRPSIEEISARYRQMQQRARDLLDHHLGPLGWSVVEPETQQDCPAFPDIDEAESRVLESWRAAEAITDSNWPEAVRIMQSITSEYGFGEPEIIVNRTGDHEIIANDSYGGVYSFGTATGTELTVTTGCHLRAVVTG